MQTSAASVAFAALLLAGPALAQTEGTGGGCVPATERAGRKLGCFILAAEPLGSLGSAPVFWHLTTLANRAQADHAKGARSTVLDALGQVWMFTIADSAWRPSSGRHVAAIGPLPAQPEVSHTAQYMEATFQPGMKSVVHRHAGPEAWYTLAGETCLETPQGHMVGRAGGAHVIVPGGPPKELTATGTVVRESLVLILHETGKPATSPAPDWTPKGLCARSSDTH